MRSSPPQAPPGRKRCDAHGLVISSARGCVVCAEASLSHGQRARIRVAVACGAAAALVGVWLVTSRGPSAPAADLASATQKTPAASASVLPPPHDDVPIEAPASPPVRSPEPPDVASATASAAPPPAPNTVSIEHREVRDEPRDSARGPSLPPDVIGGLEQLRKARGDGVAARKGP
jgi:hypothetical protein